MPGVFCQARACATVSAHCEAHLFAKPTMCVVNATIQGSTCTTSVGLFLLVQRDVVLPVFGPVGATSVAAELALVQGDVRDFNLPNGWITPLAGVDAWVAGVPLGDTTVGVYRSDIVVPGRPRLPALTGEEHVYSQTSFEVRQRGGQAGDVELVVGLVQLDHVPDGCFVRSSAGAVPDLSCPRPSSVLP